MSLHLLRNRKLNYCTISIPITADTQQFKKQL